MSPPNIPTVSLLLILQLFSIKQDLDMANIFIYSLNEIFSCTQNVYMELTYILWGISCNAYLYKCDGKGQQVKAVSVSANVALLL